MSHPNQKYITVKRCRLIEPFVQINIEIVECAANDLKPSTFKLWLYFAKNKDNYGFYLSPIVVKNSMNISESQYHKSVAELIEKGYLIQTSSNHYTFYELPQTVEDDIF